MADIAAPGRAWPAARRRRSHGHTISPRLRLALNLCGVVLGLLAWQIGAAVKANPLVFPSPVASVQALGDLVSTSDQLAQVGTTLTRVLVGFALGSALGVATALLIGAVRPVGEALEPVVHFLRSVTPVAWVVPATIWFGVGEASLRFIVVYATVFPVVLNTLAGMAAIAPNKRRMARTMGAGPLRTYVTVVIPNAVPFILTGMRLALGYSFMSVVGAEMVAGNDGLGYLIYHSRLFLQIDVMFAGILVLGIVGLASDRLLVFLSGRLMRRYYCGQEIS